MTFTIQFHQRTETIKEGPSATFAAFAPGEQIKGSISWLADQILETVEVSLLFESRGKGTPQREVYRNETHTNAGRTGEIDFSFTAPDWPWSFSGKLISLLWVLEVHDKAMDHLLESAIVISPTRAEMDLYAYATDDLAEDMIGKGWRRSQRLSVLRNRRL